MRFKNLFYTLCVAGLFSACTNDFVDEINEQTSNGEAYLSLSIALPSSNTPGTRTGYDDDNKFNQGIANEYKVNDLMLYLFKSNASDAVVAEATNIHDLGSWSTPSVDGNITKMKTFTVELTAKTTYYALVVANGNNFLTITKGSTTYGQIVAALEGKSKKDFYGNSKDNFFMSNSPIKIGDAIQTLVPCQSYATAAEAAAGTRAVIYLERILGKVQAKHGSTDWTAPWIYTVNDATSSYHGDKIKLTDWGLDITNKKTYPVRQVNSTWLDNNKFTLSGTNRFYGTNSNPVRIYYAEDPNYTGTLTYAEHFNYLGDYSGTTGNWNSLVTMADDANIDYCLENTFDVTNQKKGQTTRAVFRAEYIFNGQTDASDFYQFGANKLLKDDFYAKVKTDAGLTAAVSITSITLSKVDQGKIETIVYNDGSTNTTLNAASNEVINLNSKYGLINFFKNGICYYEARIKHFGDSQTPWTSGDYTTGGDDNVKSYLGRYGIVRNNWYRLTVTKITNGPGIPVTPPVDVDDPDDDEVSYLECEINILAWALRDQDIEW